MRKPNTLQEKVVYDGINTLVDIFIGTIIFTLLLIPIYLTRTTII